MRTEGECQNRAVKPCAECGSWYLVDASKMGGLCPECAHHLYGYPNCDHAFVDGRCSRCGWDGSRSKFIRDLIGKRGK
jgi:DNA-directed RNA polymerase subunit RPC12/RpoP